MKSANGETIVLHDYLLKYLEGDINKDQFTLIPHMIRTAFIHNPIDDAMNKSEIYKGMLSEIDKVLKIYIYP